MECEAIESRRFQKAHTFLGDACTVGLVFIFLIDVGYLKVVMMGKKEREL